MRSSEEGAAWDTGFTTRVAKGQAAVLAGIQEVEAAVLPLRSPKEY